MRAARVLQPEPDPLRGIQRAPFAFPYRPRLFELICDTAIVIYNPMHSVGRQASNIVHELAHVMLKHEPARVMFSQDEQMATRTFDQQQEDEANWLGWTLLLPRDALVAARRRRMAKAQIAREYGVSENLVRYRLQVTGVDVQMKRPRRA